MEKRIFTIEEVNMLIPALELKVNQLVQVKQQLSQLIHQLLAKGLNVEELIVETGPVDISTQKDKAELEELSIKMQGYLAEIQSIGCVVKDMDMGLVDFYGIVEGKEALLCWQSGEKKVAFWHGLEEGFGSRKPLFEDASFARDQLH